VREIWRCHGGNTLSSRVKVAVIGCGKQAPKHISGLRSIPETSIVLADVSSQFARSLGEKEGLPWVQQPSEVFSDPSVDAVDICTPTPSHFDLIQMALRSGKDFFCEKPLCERPEQGRKIASEIHRSGRIGMVGYIYRFAPALEMGQRLFQDVPATGVSKVLGPVHLAHFRIGGRGSHQLWKHRRATGGGAINEMLVHMLDLAIWYFGPVAEARILEEKLLRPRREIQGRVEEVDAEDFVVAELLMKSGTTVICQADLLTPGFTQFVEVQGENGTFMGSIDPEMPSFLYCGQGSNGWAPGRTPLKFDPKNLFEAQMAEFVHAVQTRTEPGRCRISDSVLLLEAMETLKARP